MTRGWTRREIAGLRQALERDYEREAIESNKGVVYFVQIADRPDSPIKIGVTTRGDLKNRICSLQTACPYVLGLLALMDGGYEDEQRLHKAFRHSRALGEWFWPTPALRALIEGLQAGKHKTDLTCDLYSDTGPHAGVVREALDPLTDNHQS